MLARDIIAKLQYLGLETQCTCSNVTKTVPDKTSWHQNTNALHRLLIIINIIKNSVILSTASTTRRTHAH